jgi:hypothetical protein
VNVATPSVFASAELPGWFGKLPGMGDFAHRRLPESFRAVWDPWLQRGLARLRDRHADWTSHYLEAPIWCFALGVCFPRPGLAPAGDSLSFASPKESKQRKGDPAVCDPPLRYGQPAVLAFRGVSQNSLRSNSCEP